MSHIDPATLSSPSPTAPSSNPSGNPKLDAALSYAARGWAVFPCQPKKKQPQWRRVKRVAAPK